MSTYAQWSPTGFDTKGLNLPDRQDWIVGPCMLTRDSGPMSESNFAVMVGALREAGPVNEDYEVHSFNHWACGWFEIAIARPDTACAKAMESIKERLENYAILDEDDLSSRESEAAYENFDPRDAARQLHIAGAIVQDTTVDFLSGVAKDSFLDFLQPEIDSDGEHPYYRVGKVDRDALAKFIRMERAK